MLSGTSGVVGRGNRGQASYAATNTFLDAFGHYRHSLGLCANTDDLGGFDKVGYAESAIR